MSVLPEPITDCVGAGLSTQAASTTVPATAIFRARCAIPAGLRRNGILAVLIRRRKAPECAASQPPALWRMVEDGRRLPKPLEVPLGRLLPLLLPCPRRRGRLERRNQAGGGSRHVVHGTIERLFIRARRLV